MGNMLHGMSEYGAVCRRLSLQLQQKGPDSNSDFVKSQTKVLSQNTAKERQQNSGALAIPRAETLMQQ